MAGKLNTVIVLWLSLAATGVYVTILFERALRSIVRELQHVTRRAQVLEHALRLKPQSR